MFDFYGQGATFSKVDFLRLGGLFMITTTFQYHTFSQVLFDDRRKFLIDLFYLFREHFLRLTLYSIKNQDQDFARDFYFFGNLTFSQ